MAGITAHGGPLPWYERIGPPPKKKARKMYRTLYLICVSAWAFANGTALAQTPGQIIITPDQDQLILSWSTKAWRTYKVVASDSRCITWSEVNTRPLLALGDSLSLSVDHGAGVRFYRVAELEEVTPPGMELIPAGTATIGSGPNEIDRDEDEGPPAIAIITRPFWMAKYPVTQGDYLAVMGQNPSFFNGVRDWPAPGTDYGVDLSRPVEQVTWEDAVAYCNTLTEREREASRLPEGCVYRLPTEAEWEYACRAGTTTRFSFGNDPNYAALTDHAWIITNSNSQTQPVGQKLPNPWGLYDMYGNVWEWCLDSYGPYPGGTVVDPRGPETGSARVIRGGTWSNAAAWCRSANRDTPRGATYDFGFRVVLAADSP